MFVHVILLLFLCGNLCFCTPCSHKEFKPGNIVCVCNGTYCDTLPQIKKVPDNSYLIFTSNKAGKRFDKILGNFQKLNESIRSANIITLNPEIKYQKIFGWGGAFTDAAGININSLDEYTRKNLLRSYFSDEGIEYSLCRVPIGGTDFSTHGYSYNDGEVDLNLTNFKLAHEDYALKIPLIKEAIKLRKGNLKLFASAWTAPKWMKTNGEYSGYGGYIKSNMYQSWANYHLKFLDAYKNDGISFWGITTGNEPSLALVPFIKINSVAWNAPQMSKYINENLGPTLRKSQHSQIKIMCLDDQRFFLPWFVNQLFEDKKTQKYVDGIAVHWYYDSFVPASTLDATHRSFPEKFILSTEACKGDKFYEEHVIMGSWSRGEEYAWDIIQDVNNWVSGWVDWNIALDKKGGPTYINNFVDSPIIVNPHDREFYKQPMFYALGHFSKFIPPESHRIFFQSTNNKIHVSAFIRPDNGIVVVILNGNGQKVPVEIKDAKRGVISLILTEHSLHTVIYW